MAANIRPKNNQDAFDKVLEAIRNQNYQQSAEGEAWLYRGPNDTCCGIGHMILDEMYSKGLEKRSIGEIIKDNSALREYFQNVNTVLLQDIQYGHDDCLGAYDRNNSYWEEFMKDLAIEYNLTYTAP